MGFRFRDLFEDRNALQKACIVLTLVLLVPLLAGWDAQLSDHDPEAYGLVLTFSGLALVPAVAAMILGFLPNKRY